MRWAREAVDDGHDYVWSTDCDSRVIARIWSTAALFLIIEGSPWPKIS